MTYVGMVSQLHKNEGTIILYTHACIFYFQGGGRKVKLFHTLQEKDMRGWGGLQNKILPKLNFERSREGAETKALPFQKKQQNAEWLFIFLHFMKRM